MSTRAQTLAEITTQFPDNNSGLITPAKLRQVVEDIATSYNNSTDEGTPAAAVAGHDADPTAHTGQIEATRPDSFPWDFSTWPIAPSYVGGRVKVGSAGVTPEQLFDAVSTARSLPGATFYVNIATGNDANSGLTSGTAFQSIWKAVSAANTAGVPTKVIIAPGVYPRTNSFGGGVGASVDIAFIASGGTVVSGTFDQYANPSTDATYANCYSWTVANVARVFDISTNPGVGYREMLKVGSREICNSTPGSWHHTGSTLYVHRAGVGAVTNANTRVYRPSSNCFLCTNRVSIYFGGIITSDRFILEGGQQGCISYNVSSALSGVQSIVAKNVTLIAPGDYSVATTAVCLRINSLNGLAAFFNVAAFGAMTDGINVHNDANDQAEVRVLTVNCYGRDFGRAGNTSCNAYTLHEDVSAVDVCGDYAEAHGGCVRNIGTSTLWMVGTNVGADLGDGVTIPAGVMADVNAKIWADGVENTQPANALSWYSSSGAFVYRRACSPSRNDAGFGVISEY